MTGLTSKLWVPIACMVLFLFLILLPVCNTLSKADAKTVAKPEAKPEVRPEAKPETKAVAPEAGRQLEEKDMGDADWFDGMITQTPHLDPKTKKMLITIRNVPYVLNENAVIMERGLDSSGDRYEKVVSIGALVRGRNVLFEAAGPNHKIIGKILIDLLPHRD
jgi:hypothetical protein